MPTNDTQAQRTRDERKASLPPVSAEAARTELVARRFELTEIAEQLDDIPRAMTDKGPDFKRWVSGARRAFGFKESRIAYLESWLSVNAPTTEPTEQLGYAELLKLRDAVTQYAETKAWAAKRHGTFASIEGAFDAMLDALDAADDAMGIPS